MRLPSIRSEMEWIIFNYMSEGLFFDELYFIIVIIVYEIIQRNSYKKRVFDQRIFIYMNQADPSL